MLISMADVDMWIKEYYDLSYEVQIDMQLSVFVTSKKQTIVAKSSKEAEMIAVSDHTREPIAQNEFYINQYGSNKLAISS